MTPPTRVRSTRLLMTNAPMKDADAPSEVKTTENPRMNTIDARNTRPRCWRRSAICISQRETPETNDTYPGMSGATQGEKNPSTPAAKATTRLSIMATVY